MRSVIQRVFYASVEVEGRTVGRIDRGILAMVGFQPTDEEKDYQYMIDKIINLRIFEDDEGKMNRSVIDMEGGVLLVPNFTLYGDARHGRRPSYSDSSSPKDAHVQFDAFCGLFRHAFPEVQTGLFQTEMKVSLLNDGPVTILLDSDRKF
jgi:D-tyrosyl-tRNA(Tyr) deacylase